MAMPKGGVDTGLGGTAPNPASDATPWLAMASAGGLLALAGGIAIRRMRRRTPQPGAAVGPVTPCRADNQVPMPAFSVTATRTEKGTEPIWTQVRTDLNC